MTPEDTFTRTAANRIRIADFLQTLTPEQWEEPSLCPGWTVRHVAAHLVQPMLVGFSRFLLASFRYRGNTAATVDHFTRRLAERDPTELVALLRAHADDSVNPPRVGPMGPFAETCIHLRDIARPLHLKVTATEDDWVELLDYLVSPRAAPALVPAGGVGGICLRATDAHWQHGAGPVAEGPLEALAMTIAGRTAAFDDLHGTGVATLHARLRPGDETG